MSNFYKENNLVDFEEFKKTISEEFERDVRDLSCIYRLLEKLSKKFNLEDMRVNLSNNILEFDLEPQIYCLYDLDANKEVDIFNSDF